MSTFPFDKVEWNDEVKQTAKNILAVGLRERSNKIFVQEWLSNLLHIIKYCNDTTSKLYVESLKDEITKLFKTERPNRELIIIIQLLNGINSITIENLVNESINDWSDSEFESLLRYIDFKRLWSLNAQFMYDLEARILDSRNSAEKNNNNEKYYRL